MNPPSSHPLRRGQLTLFVVGSFFLYMARFGYGYGVSDQDEFLPLVMHRLDPSLFTTDWFVGTQTAAFSVRTYFSWLVQATSIVLPLPGAIFLVYAASFAGLAVGVHRIAWQLTQDGLAVGLAIPLVLVATPFWTLGGNDLAHSMLVPSMTAWALGLWGWGEALRGRPARAALWMGMATWMQALVGLQLGLLAGLMSLFEVRRSGLKSTFQFAGVYAAMAAPALIPLFYQQFTAHPPLGADLYYIMAQFRNPHHYLFHSFPERSYVRFGVLLGLGIISWKYLASNGLPESARQVWRLLGIVAGLGGLAYVATEQMALLTVAKLQLFMPTVLAKVLLLVGVAGAAARHVPRGAWMGWMERRAIPFGMAGLLVGTMVWIGSGRAGTMVHPWSERQTPERELTDWVQAHTPADAIVAVPPSASFFRTGARRAIVVNHKAFPYRDADIVAWFARLNDLAPIALPARTDATLLGRLDTAYETLQASDLDTLARRYGITYVVRKTPLDDRSPVFEAPPWSVYRWEETP